MRILAVLFLIAAGCIPEEAPPAPAVPSLFDISGSGSIEGTVRWAGPVPRVEAFRSLEFVQDPVAGPGNRMRSFPNPAAPRVDDEGGLAGAVVFLRGIDPARAKPWDHPPLRARLRDLRLVLSQGGREVGIGIVPLGSALRIVSEDACLHTIKGRGASFFGLALPDKGSERAWPLDEPGLLELRSGAGFFWMRGHVLASAHPYAALTDLRGRFRLEGVPEGEYEIVAMHPDWRVVEQERNVDNLRVTGARFGPPLEKTARLRVGRGTAARVGLTLRAGAETPRR